MGLTHCIVEQKILTGKLNVRESQLRNKRSN